MEKVKSHKKNQQVLGFNCNKIVGDSSIGTLSL